jgi:Methylase involved in ubiquinone/menaquinone biosynthesis
VTVREMHESNRAAWNEGALRYAQEVEEDITFLRGGGINLDAPEMPYLKDLRDWCGRAIHLQCAGGRDTLSLWNLGAKEVVGVDISDRMIACARQKSEALNAPALWFRSDILGTPHELDGTADLVYTGRGALCWVQDIDAWAAVAARLLKPGGGQLFVYDGHPLAWVWDMEADHFALDPVYGDYFSREVVADQGWPEQYIGDIGIPTEQQAKKYERQWTLADIVNAVSGAGLRVARLGEHPDAYWDQFPNIPPDTLRRLPQTFTLLAERS